MKKGLVVLAVLVMTLPLYAGTITFTVTDPCDGTTCTIDWASDVPIVAIGLDIDASAPVNIDSVDPCSWFEIFIDLAWDEETNGDGYDYGEGSGTANNAAAQKGQAGKATMPSAAFAISAGGLGGASAPLGPPPTSGSIVLSGTAPVSGTIGSNSLRGGVIDNTGAGVTLAGDSTWTITDPVVAEDCMQVLDVDNSHPAVYAMFLKAGSPACWCDEYNCQGDADNLFTGTDADGKRKWVTLPDLVILDSGWGKKESVMPNALAYCADADRLFTGTDAAGKRKWVTLPDLTILSASWGKKESVMPTGPHQVPCHGY